MSALAVRLSLGAARAWTRLYSAGARTGPREARRDQIASDLWEHEADAVTNGQAPAGLAGELLGRVVRGIPSDIAWRLNTGGMEMKSTFVIERGSGLVMLLVILLMAGTLSGPGISGEEPYFTYDFPNFTRSLDSAYRATLFQFAVGGVTFVAAGLLYLTFRPYSRAGATLGGAALALAGVIFIAGAIAGLQLHALAGEWRDTGHVRGDATWLQARDAAGLVENSAFFGMGILALSFLSFGAVIARSAALPRAFGFPAMIGAVIVVASFVVWAIGPIAEAGWFVFMLGLLAVTASFVLTAGWLTIRGTRRPGPSGPAAA
jgi:hypothetical protein